MTDTTTGTNNRSDDRRTLIRDASVLQVKLILDGLRDLLLVPASIIAAIMSGIDGYKGKPGTQFYDLLEIGKRSDSWIDLFGALRDRGVPEQPGGSSIDDVVNRIETYIVDEYRRGGVTRQAKDHLDQLLAAFRKR
jgi:hypothetical protein